MQVESRVFYTTISQRSCHVQHSTCSQNAAGHSFFNIQEYLTAFSTLHCTVRKRILHGKSAYTVHTVCSYIAQNAHWITGVLYHDYAAILPCTALFVQPKCTDTLHVQHTRVSNCFLKHYIVLEASVFYMGKVGTVFIRCVTPLYRMCVG